jgi:hypothetical protein
VKTYDNRFGSRAELQDWLEGTCTANWSIPAEIKSEFFESLVDRFLVACPQQEDADGFVTFRMSMIELIATKR